MRYKIATYHNHKSIEKWVSGIYSNINSTHSNLEFKVYNSIKPLLVNLESKVVDGYKNQFILLDTEDELHFDYLNQIKEISNEIRFIAIGLPKESEQIKLLLSNGYYGFLDISCSELELLKAINHIYSNKHYLSDANIEDLIISSITELNKSPKLEDEKYLDLSLTTKDKEVVGYILKGYTYKQVSQILGITTFAVNQRTKSVYKKCGVRSRSELSYLLLK